MRLTCFPALGRVRSQPSWGRGSRREREPLCSEDAFPWGGWRSPTVSELPAGQHSRQHTAVHTHLRTTRPPGGWGPAGSGGGPRSASGTTGLCPPPASAVGRGAGSGRTPRGGKTAPRPPGPGQEAAAHQGCEDRPDVPLGKHRLESGPAQDGRRVAEGRPADLGGQARPSVRGGDGGTGLGGGRGQAGEGCPHCASVASGAEPGAQGPRCPPLPATLRGRRGAARPSVPVSRSPSKRAPSRRPLHRAPGRAAPHLDHADTPVRQVQHQQDEQVQDLVLQRECEVRPLDLGQEGTVGLEGGQAQGLRLLRGKTTRPPSAGPRGRPELTPPTCPSTASLHPSPPLF